MNKDMRTEAVLADARRIAGQPIEDRLNGKQGDAATQVIIRLLETAGLEYVEALNLTSAAGWERWGAGWEAGYRSGRGEGN